MKIRKRIGGLEKKLIIIFFSVFLVVNSSAQITGIGTKNPESTTSLEVSSNTKVGGVLIPRLQLVNRLDIATIPNPEPGLIIYNLGNNGTGDNRVEANCIYFWDGSRWKDLADRQSVRKLLLPAVFFVQCEGSGTTLTITGSDLTDLNNGTGITVTFPTNAVKVNNFNNITLNSNSTFLVNNAGDYEVSAFINYSPYLINGYDSDNTYNDYINARTSLEFRIQVSTNKGNSWATVATSRSTWSLLTGSYFRNVILPPAIIQSLKKGDLLRLVIARPDNYGGAHGSGGTNPSISIGEGTVITRNIRISKIE
jgi:hypothetical protein